MLDFEKSVSVVDVALVLHNMSEWDRFKVETSCLMAKREQLVNMFQEQEIAKREKFQLKEEKHNYQRQLGQMMEKIGPKDRLGSTSVAFWNCYTACGESPSGGTAIGNGSRTASIFQIRTYPTR